MKHWKPVLFTLSIIAIVVILIPALLVVPFSDRLETAAEPEPLPKEKQKKEDPVASINVFRNQKNTVETVDLEDYVVGVVAAEMPSSFEMEALKAQALTARTFVTKTLTAQKKKENPAGADITDTVNDQVYLSDEELRAQWGNQYEERRKRIQEAVQATKGQILTYKDELITPSFFSTSNGYTENSEDYWQNSLPYLRSVESPWDKKSPKYLQETKIALSEFERLLGIQVGSKTDIGQIISRTDGKRIAQIKIGGKTLTGKEVREKLNLKSSDFTWYRTGNQVVITTKGYGHGVGMSQYGANGMAQEGKTYKDIIAHYYKGVTINEATAYLPTITAKK